MVTRRPHQTLRGGTALSFDNVRRALEDNEALINYDSLKKQNAALNEFVIKLQTQMQDMRTNYEDKIQVLEDRLAKLESLQIRYNKCNYTLRSFDKLVASRVERECRSRIVKEVQERWVAESPSMVKEAVKKDILGFPTNCSPEAKTTVESQGVKHAENILRYKYNWPQWFQTIYQQEVNLGVQEGLDKAFWNNLNLKATDEINRRVNYEWPKFILEKVTPRFQGTLTEQLKMLNQTIQINCDKCGSAYNIDIGPDLIASLIKEPFISVKCLNSSCKDLFLLPHSFPLTLGYVIYYITKSNSKDSSSVTFI